VWLFDTENPLSLLIVSLYLKGSGVQLCIIPLVLLLFSVSWMFACLMQVTTGHIVDVMSSCSPYCSVSSLVVILGDIIDGKDRRRSGEAEGRVGLWSGRTV
jgi:hypothetical protein